MRAIQRGSSSNVKISDFETLRFLALCENEPVLWNTKLEGYQNQDVRKAAAERISDLMDIDGFDTQQVLIKFDNLKASYLQELREINENRKSYSPRNFVFSRMNAFLKSHVGETQKTLENGTVSSLSSLESVHPIQEQEEQTSCIDSSIKNKSSIQKFNFNRDSNDKSDEFDILGNFLAVSARKLQRANQIKLKHLVLQALIQCEQEDLTEIT